MKNLFYVWFLFTVFCCGCAKQGLVVGEASSDHATVSVGSSNLQIDKVDKKRVVGVAESFYTFGAVVGAKSVYISPGVHEIGGFITLVGGGELRNFKFTLNAEPKKGYIIKSKKTYKYTDTYPKKVKEVEYSIWIELIGSGQVLGYAEYI